MPQFIDWEFIGTLEGRSLTGYVPNPDHSISGVTVGIGVDLGSVKPETLPTALHDKLAPYCGLQSHEAVQYLAAHPLVLLDSEIDTLDAWAAERILLPLRNAWQRDCKMNFNYINARLATVVTSVAYQYGNVCKHCPNFWATATSLDINAVVKQLENFGDAYSTRRKKEAAYLLNTIHQVNNNAHS